MCSGSWRPRPAPTGTGSRTRRTLPCEARLAARLLDASATDATPTISATPTGATVTTRATATLPGGQRELADLLGVTRVTVNRALSRLRHDGLIGPPRNGRIEILAPELLALRAAPDGQPRPTS